MSNALDLIKQNQGAGMEDIDSGSSMPLIKILQKASAEVDEDHKDHGIKGIEGAKAGDIVFAPEQAVLEQPTEFLPLGQTSVYVEWRPKKLGGGMVATHPLSIVTNPQYHKEGHNEFLGDNDLLLTIYYCVMFLDGEQWKRAIISFSKSNLKHARSMGKQIRGFKYHGDSGVDPFIFSRSFNLGTQLVRGEENSWYEFDIKPSRVLDFESDAALIEEGFTAFKDAQESLPKPQVQATPALTAAEDTDVPF